MTTRTLFDAKTGAEVRKLVKKGANVNAVNEDGLTPLYTAILKCRGGAVNTLIAAGADVNAVDEYGSTPLYWAKQNGHERVAATLEVAGAKEE